MTAQNFESKRGLLRKLGLLDTTFLVIGSVIGSGIFMTSGFIAEYLPSPGLILLVWLVGGLFTIFGALSFAELGAMFPEAGGQYIYIREAYGHWAGFFFGWGFFWFIMCGGIATLAVGFAEFFGSFVPSLSTQAVLLRVDILGTAYSLSAGQLVAMASIIILTAVNYLGIKSGSIVQNIFTFLRLGSVAAIVVFGLALGRKAGITRLDQFFAGGGGLSPATFKMFGLALIAVLWTYDGWYGVNCTAEEIKRPERNIPLGLILGTLAVTLVYLLMNVVYILAIPVSKMKGVTRVGELASAQLFGPTVTSVFSAAVMVSVFGCLSATIIYGPRVYLAMSEDKAFFKSMSYVHPRFRVPTKALRGQAVWSCILCLTGTYQALYEYVVFALVIYFAATGFSVIVLRRKMPDKPRPYRAWGYPVVPLLFVLVNIAVFFNTILAQPVKSLIGLGIIGLGLPAYLYWKRGAGGPNGPNPATREEE
jgi:APA family basic amino acid/polyamine antiporter